ncbi:hypothetical protein [Mastigocoleus sp. MO_188.B34]|uniref:hypothetical protein n=1 Tax=Mastigocoleus sp. MO_188.B34 TaxID=3036635 RepID=UPI002613D65E|nr:hypothetical protein [Mastigocoleus sp. MO_188.B34]MDJ0693010.1 hypothetical protein [Mastigocoleus sp. MO_188.B34]
MVKLTKQTDEYTKRAMAMARGEGLEIAEPISIGGPVPYPWFNVILAGPFQPLLPGGPFLPQKVIRAGEPAFMIGIVWRNPVGVNWDPTAPQANVLMAAYNLRVWLETCNVTTCGNGPDFGPINFAPLGGGFLNGFIQPINFPVPQQGRPNLYEMNLTADVSGPVGGLPFAGYATWVFNPDLEPAIFPPFIRPGVPPHWDYDKPARFLVYTA